MCSRLHYTVIFPDGRLLETKTGPSAMLAYRSPTRNINFEIRVKAFTEPEVAQRYLDRRGLEQGRIIELFEAMHIVGETALRRAGISGTTSPIQGTS